MEQYHTNNGAGNYDFERERVERIYRYLKLTNFMNNKDKPPFVRDKEKELEVELGKDYNNV